MLRRSLGLRSTLHTAKHTRPYITPPTWSPLRVLADSSVEVFRKEAFNLSVPAILPRGLFLGLPAVQKWFSASEVDSRVCLNHEYLAGLGDFSVPLEYTEVVGTTFQRSEAPFKIFLDWAQHATTNTPSRLYLAQASFNDLPESLVNSLPVPDVVKKAGRGDVYDANLWMGVPPTYTPLHRDPNPNLFVQLAGKKVVRLLSPENGREVFATVQTALGRSASATFRGDEMMHGEEKAMLEAQIWNDEPADGGMETSGYEACLERGDGIFIPKGWWHSIKGVGNGINGSVSEEPRFVAHVH